MLKLTLDRQAEDMYGRPTGPRHEELSKRASLEPKAKNKRSAPRRRRAKARRRSR